MSVDTIHFFILFCWFVFQIPRRFGHTIWPHRRWSRIWDI